jgi:hypothetical protein
VSEPKPNRIRGRVIDSGDQLSKKLLLSYVVILALSMSLVPYSIDPFLPAFPEIATYFGVPEKALSPLGPWPSFCNPDCCPNLRKALPVIAEG